MYGPVPWYVYVMNVIMAPIKEDVLYAVDRVCQMLTTAKNVLHKKKM